MMVGLPGSGKSTYAKTLTLDDKPYIIHSSDKLREELKEIDDKGVYINDVSYLYKDDYKYLDYAKMIKEGKVIGEYELNSDKLKHLNTLDEVNKMTNKNTLTNMEYIYNNCNLELTYTDVLLPIYDKNIKSK